MTSEGDVLSVSAHKWLTVHVCVCGHHRLGSWLPDPCPACQKLVSYQAVKYVPAANLQGAVDLLDELADVLAEVSRGDLPTDDRRVFDALVRAARHANGGQ